MAGKAIFRQDEFLTASLDFGSTSIELADYATTGIWALAIGPSGVGKSNLGLLMTEQLAVQGWVCVLFLVRDALGGQSLRITPVGMAMLRGVAAGEAAARNDREWVGVYVAAQIVCVSIATVHRWRRLGEVIIKRGPRWLLFERSSLEMRARRYWVRAMIRYKRAQPPAWLQLPERAA